MWWLGDKELQDLSAQIRCVRWALNPVIDAMSPCLVGHLCHDQQSASPAFRNPYVRPCSMKSLLPKLSSLCDYRCTLPCPPHDSHSSAAIIDCIYNIELLKWCKYSDSTPPDKYVPNQEEGRYCDVSSHNFISGVQIYPSRGLWLICRLPWRTEQINLLRRQDI